MFFFSFCFFFCQLQHFWPEHCGHIKKPDAIVIVYRWAVHAAPAYRLISHNMASQWKVSEIFYTHMYPNAHILIFKLTEEEEALKDIKYQFYYIKHEYMYSKLSPSRGGNTNTTTRMHTKLLTQKKIENFQQLFLWCKKDKESEEQEKKRSKWISKLRKIAERTP